MTTTIEVAAEAWVMDHHLHVLMQIESRPLPPHDEGQRWVERRLTGKATAVCSCGYTSGLVDSKSLPPVQALAAEHPRRINVQFSGLNP
ncbi:hypothetical protein B6E66_07365 [Streptomyces maremycinicus]|nr:hypothetical protein B6E66_07365 [Streptomyces sp. B9173]